MFAMRLHSVNPKRVRTLSTHAIRPGPIIYWMSRDQRVQDNWALLYAQELARKHNTTVQVVFCLVPTFLEATLRQYDFMLRGLREVEGDLRSLSIPFSVVLGSPGEAIPEFLDRARAGALVADFSPLRIYDQWKEMVKKKISIPLFEVDAHNIVPCWQASPKQEFAARTFRPKILSQLPEFLEPFPALKKQIAFLSTPTDWDMVERTLQINRDVTPVEWITPGERAAEHSLSNFISKKLSAYESSRNDPAIDGQSNLSPYLHFGQLSAARIVMEVRKHHPSSPSSTAFLEELVVRRELADNFCFYNKKYDTAAGFPAWATESLQKHKKDERPVTYTDAELERSKTHDDLWNAAQTEMVRHGKMHGYLRMYWAKKILEWTKSPEDAMKIAIYLNDKYELDGRDPNGYVGIAWSIGGVHDRPWFERAIFGSIRYMSRESTGRKCHAKEYIKRVTGAGKNSLL